MRDTIGKLVRIIRTADPMVAITPEEVAAQLDRRIPKTLPADVRERNRARPHASVWPPYNRIHVDGSGRLWVQDYRVLLPAPNSWTAFDQDGRVLGRLVIPPSSPRESKEVVGFGRDEVLIAWRDVNAILYFMVYPVVAAPSRE